MDNNCLRVIGNYCKQLRYHLVNRHCEIKAIICWLRNLDVSNCYNVTDQGIQLLCYQENGDPGCSLIQQISTEWTNVTSLGVKQILLTQKKLIAIKSKSTILALSELANEFSENGDRRTFPIIKISQVTIASRYALHRIRLAASICRNLVIDDIKIRYGYGFSNQEICSISSLPNLYLKEMSFEYWFDRERNLTTDAAFNLDTYFNGMAHLLNPFGRGLKKLDIYNTLNVNMTTVLSCCPNLSILILTANSYHISNFPRSILPLRQLETFQLRTWCKPQHETHYRLPGNVILFLLSSHTLNHLYITDCVTFTNAILEKALERTNFRNLKSFNIEFCDYITNSGLNLLKSGDNAISDFSVKQCRRVDHERLSKEWRTFKRENNWNVKINIQYNPDYEYEEEAMDAYD